MQKFIPVLARLLLAQIFLVAIVIQLTIIMNNPNGYEDFRLFLGLHGLPGIFAPLMIAVQLLGSLALLLGFKSRAAANVMAGYSVFVAVALHLNEPIVFLQYMAIAGGLLAFSTIAPTALSLDNLKK